jgi:hypothetical protein
MNLAQIWIEDDRCQMVDAVAEKTNPGQFPEELGPLDLR